MSVLARFLNKRSEDPAETGAVAGGAVGAPIFLQKVLKDLQREKMAEKLPTTSEQRAFESYLKPGDLVFTKSKHREWYTPLMELFTGTRYPHVDAYSGPGKMHVIMGADDIFSDADYDKMMKQPGYSYQAFRPTENPAEIDEAMRNLKGIEGKGYVGNNELLKRSLRMAVNAKTSVPVCDKNMACADIPHEMFPKKFGRYEPFAEMMDKMKPVAALEKGGSEAPEALSKFLTRFGYPALRSLAPALAVGGTVAGGLGLAKLLKKDKKNGRGS